MWVPAGSVIIGYNAYQRKLCFLTCVSDIERELKEKKIEGTWKGKQITGLIIWRLISLWTKQRVIMSSMILVPYTLKFNLNKPFKYDMNMEVLIYIWN